MDIRCPVCNKLYPEIDFALAASKFGCECGHKFFLSDEGADSKVETERSNDRDKNERAPSVPEPEPEPENENKQGACSGEESRENSKGQDDLEDDGKKTDEDASGHHATSLMDVVCPKCEKAYLDIEASLVGSKFGCECGHKFFLERESSLESAKKAEHLKGNDKPAEEDASENKAEPFTTDRKESEDRIQAQARVPERVPSPAVRNINRIDLHSDLEEDPEDSDMLYRHASPPPRRVSQSDSPIIGWILNLILVSLLISLAYFSYLFFTDQLEVPFEIKLQFKEEAETVD